MSRQIPFLTRTFRLPRLHPLKCISRRNRKQLAEIANQAATETEDLVKSAALRLLERDANFRAAVRKGIEQADRGEFVRDDEMAARIERML
jgi:predicted transcriptional regulator